MRKKALLKRERESNTIWKQWWLTLKTRDEQEALIKPLLKKMLKAMIPCSGSSSNVTSRRFTMKLKSCSTHLRSCSTNYAKLKKKRKWEWNATTGRETKSFTVTNDGSIILIFNFIFHQASNHLRHDWLDTWFDDRLITILLIIFLF